MPTLPYFNSGFSQIEIDYANWCRKQDAAALAEKIASKKNDGEASAVSGDRTEADANSVAR